MAKAIPKKRMCGEADISAQSIEARIRVESKGVEKSTVIRKWQDRTVEQPSGGSGGIMSRLFNGCIRLLRSILQALKDGGRSHRDCMQLRDSLLALSLWSDDHHLSTADLDTQLCGHEELQELVCSLLLSLADLLVNGLLQHLVASPAERHAILFENHMLSLMEEAKKEASNVESPVDYTGDDVPDMASTLATLADCLISLPRAHESDSEFEDNATATDGSHSTSSQDDHSISVPRIATSEESRQRRRKELENLPNTLARCPEVVIKDQPSQVPTIGQPTEHSVSTALHSSGDPMPDDGHAIMSPDTIVGGVLSPEGSLLDKDWTPKHIDRSAGLSTNPSFQGSSNNAYRHQIGTSQVPSTYIRHNYPPVNPADQNPPCNTLYVGNLPIDTSEDELKTMFSKQPGYKRLCFRTKANGPMCFVEFEDVSFATRALNELYGYPLHNSVKGGIRLSFSKNPLGVRNGRNNSNNIPLTQMTPHNTIPGIRSGRSPRSPAVGRDFHEPEPPYQGLDESKNQPFKDSSNVNV